MRIVQVLNNNVAIVKKENTNQAIVMGLGIAFKKKKGDLIQTSKVEKIFYLKTEESQENFSILLKDIPIDFITISYEYINSVIEKFHYPVQEYIYVTLTDHIYASYQAVLKDTYLQSQLPNIKYSHPLEYEIGRNCVDFLEKELAIIFPEDEIGRIALHFINAKDNFRQDIRQKEYSKTDIISLIRKFLSDYGIKRCQDNRNYYDRLMVHLSYFVDRLGSREQQVKMLEIDENLKQAYPKSYQIGFEICQLIVEKFGYPLNPNEHIYLIIHIQRLLNQGGKESE